MKRIITLIFALTMLMLLAACGNSTSEQSTSAGTENVAETEETTEPTASQAVSETPDESETGASAFDTSWASNDFEAMIPELPFKGWKVTEETDSGCKMELSGLKTENGADTVSGFGEDKDALIAYLNSLPTYGFTVEEKGVGYKWLVTDKKGNTITFTCSDGFCWIEFRKAN